MIKAKKTRAHGVNLFLVELIAVLLFFSVSCAVILNVFSAANSKAEKSLQNEKIILCAQSVSELYSKNGSMSEAAMLFDGAGRAAEGAVSSYAVYLDKELRGVSDMQSADIVFFMVEQVENKAGGTLKELSYTFLSTEVPVLFEYEYVKGGAELFSGSCSAYIPDFEVSADA